MQQVRKESTKALAKTKSRYQKTLRDLEKKEKTAEGKIKRLIGKSDLAWGDFRKGLARAASDIDRAVKKALSEFKK